MPLSQYEKEVGFLRKHFTVHVVKLWPELKKGKLGIPVNHPTNRSINPSIAE